ncbi:MAG: Uma2 family endonuclease [Acetobacteraceae bacterium]|nr:Uma2 family endonuclease [Acetobacteraceae bacterium]
MTVEIGEATDYEPDAVVNCGEKLPDDAIAAPNPVIIVEVLSPSTRAIDSGAKLADYFRLPSVMHYLLLRTDRPQLIHHRRTGATLETQIVWSGSVTLEPPGITLHLGDIFGA